MSGKLKNLVLFLCGVVLLTACIHKHGDLRLSTDPSGIRWGFTTQNFLPTVPVSLEAAKRFVSYAKKEGFSWIELRDPDASLSVEQCREIAAFAGHNGIEVVYSMQRGLLADDFEVVFDRALANTKVFNGLQVVRVLALRSKEDWGWTDTEFSRAVTVANKAAQQAAGHGCQLMIENADVVLDGTGKDCFGMIQLMETVDPEILLQLDTANLFTGPQPVTPQQAEEFIRTYARRIIYVHLKSARDGKAQPVLSGNSLNFRTIFSLLAESGKTPHVAIELASGTANTQQVFKNMQSSLDWLRNEELITTGSPTSQQLRRTKP